ncbi:Recombination inhibitory protein MutS2 [hydrothermal vent metagenome]|uniref:Recombination inhibitory protein MutS2 n=1 Tax=hydrothermal vent metagenome TaxID=652676 RepID=A0A3B0TYB8_9ZZZZ
MPGTYPENFEIKTGFDKIRELLFKRCLSPLGKEHVGDMHFMVDFEKLTQLHGEVGEFCRIIREFDQFPTNHYYDVRPALQRIKTEGSFLEVTELFDLKRSLESVRAIISFFNKQEGNIFPLLKKKTGLVQVFPYIYGRIDSIINKNGQVRDNASPELASIRKNILLRQSSMSKRLHSILKQAQADGLVEEGASVAIRDGRAVIPISSSKKRKLKGIVYDESATGKTAYIEPNEIVEMNNEVRELENEERREVVKILVEFSNNIRPYLEELGFSYNFLGDIDFIRAKALLAIDFNAVKTELVNHPALEWQKAIHPLLKLSLQKENRKIVPLDISLSKEKHILLISGPNAGGKSVCLKTVGLLQYMLQCGLLIPVAEESKTGVFNKIFIDIGDEQSIENDLSTYSSHLLNMKYFIKHCNEESLVLIDEFGTGTEPMLGGAIAEAILNQLNKSGTFGVITTHYTNLKHFAASAKGIENGAMLYDAHQMDPLFKLEAGKPGSSFAFEIARKIGLPENILQDATEKVGKKHIDFDKNLKDIIRDKRYWEGKRQRIRKVEKTLDNLAGQYENELKEAESQRKEIIKKAKEDAAQLLAGVNKKIENTIYQIRVSQAEKEKTKKLREELEALKKEVAKKEVKDDKRISQKIEKLKREEGKRNKRRPYLEDVQEEAQAEAKAQAEANSLQPGDKVRIKGQDIIGELMQINKKNAVVAFGQLITTLPRQQVEKISNNAAKKAGYNANRAFTNITQNINKRKLTFKPEIDIRGQRVEEAITTIREFIDEAIMLEQSQLRILHGKGYGILKETIRDFLRAEPMVKNFKDEHVRLGGAGITIVNLAL